MELVTAPLDRGDILPGVTRRSILELAKGWGQQKSSTSAVGSSSSSGSCGVTRVSERWVPMAELVEAAAEGRLLEAFGAGKSAHKPQHNLNTPCLESSLTFSMDDTYPRHIPSHKILSNGIPPSPPLYLSSPHFPSPPSLSSLNFSLRYGCCGVSRARNCVPGERNRHTHRSQLMIDDIHTLCSVHCPLFPAHTITTPSPTR